MQEEITRLVQGLDDSALRFIEACVRHERETRNAPQVPPPSTPHPGGQFTVPENVRHLTSEQLDAVSKAFLDWYKASVSTTQGRSRGRLWLVFLLIRYGALRLGEVLSIDDRTDLDFARSVVSVRGQNFRELQFPEAIMTEIRQVLESPLMFGLRGEVLHLDQGYVRRIFYERAKDVDLPKELLSPRVIRHSRGIELLRGDVPLKIVQQFLGQQSPTLTARYLHFSREDARKIVHSHIRREALKKTSARNAFTGTINRIKRGDLLVEVEILTSTGLQVVSIITAESADNLELREGINTTATIKAPWVIISTGDALPLAPGNFTGIPLGQMPDLETLQKIIYGFAGRRGGAAEQGPLRLVEREFHISADRQMREQGVVLKNIPEMTLTGREIDALLRSIQHIVPNLDVSAVRPDQPRQRLEGKRLAGTGVPEQDKPPGGAAQGHVEGKTVAAFPPRGEALAYLHIKHQRPPAFPPNNLSARTRMVRHRHDVNTTSTVACSSLPA